MDNTQKHKYTRIAIMGGTFDPIHYGHLATAESVRCKYNADKVFFIPSGCPPHKDINFVTNNERRYEMTLLATKSNPNFEVSRIEIDRPGRTYTIDTITELKEKYGSEVEILFITGADVVHSIFTWKSWEKLLTLCDFVAATRPGYKKSEMFKRIEFMREAYESKIHLIEVPELDISSSDIRERVSEGRTIKYLLPECVEEYIYENSLYK